MINIVNVARFKSPLSLVFFFFFLRHFIISQCFFFDLKFCVSYIGFIFSIEPKNE